MDEPKTNDDWLQQKLDVGRLFSAAPLSKAIRRRENLYPGLAAMNRSCQRALHPVSTEHRR